MLEMNGSSYSINHFYFHRKLRSNKHFFYEYWQSIMSPSAFVSPDVIRARFSQAMSAMYREEVPLYGALIDLVTTVNQQFIEQNPQGLKEFTRTTSLVNLSEERHGAIRLGTAEELNTMRRLFTVMGMFPVDYYDLSVAGIPVHSTAFRPLTMESLNTNPFRVFTSLLRLDLIRNTALRASAEHILSQRNIFTEKALSLIEIHEQHGGLTDQEATIFVTEALESFRWHKQALVDKQTYGKLKASHTLIADIVSFKGPHINHLTPRTLDIDAAQARMHDSGISAKAIIEGPPSRKHPILLRQTSFKALEESVLFQQNIVDKQTNSTALFANSLEEGADNSGNHTARFGEIEQRGMALTPKGRALYDQLLAEVREQVPTPETNPDHYTQTLNNVFAAFPDDLTVLRRAALAYFEYRLAPGLPNTALELLHKMLAQNEEFKQCLIDGEASSELDGLIALNLIEANPLTYEDFLPVSAAGIFRSNLNDSMTQSLSSGSNQAIFERALGTTVHDAFAWYENIQKSSLKALLHI